MDQEEKDSNNKWLAETLSINRSAVSKWATNNGRPTVERLFMIAEVLEVNVQELLNLTLQGREDTLLGMTL